MEETITPFVLPEKEDHSFFFVDVCISPIVEAKLHQHDAWELYYLIHGYGSRIAGDTVQKFSAGDVVLIPPSMPHHLNFDLNSTDQDGNIRYLMVAFDNAFFQQCRLFPELRNRLIDISLPTEALKFGAYSANIISDILVKMNEMDELDRLCQLLKLLPLIFSTSDYVSVGKPLKIEKNVRRMQHIVTYVMRHHIRTISLDEIAAEVGMNRSAFCTYFKRMKGITFSQFVSQYRLETACELLKNSEKQVSEICFITGFNDLPHFIRAFTKAYGLSPLKYRKQSR